MEFPMKKLQVSYNDVHMNNAHGEESLFYQQLSIIRDI